MKNNKSFCKFLGEQAETHFTVLKKILEKPKLTEGIKAVWHMYRSSDKSSKKLQDMDRYYLQMREGRINMVAATTEDDNKEYYSNTDGLIANPINLKTRQRFRDV